MARSGFSYKTMKKGFDPKAPLQGYSDEMGGLKEQLRDQIMAWFDEFYEGGWDGKGSDKPKKTASNPNRTGITKGAAKRATRSLMLSDDSLWGPVIREHFERGGNIKSLMGAVRGKLQSKTTRGSALFPWESGHHANNLQSFDAIWRGPAKTLQRFLQRGADEGEYFGDTFKNFEGNAYIPQAHIAQTGAGKQLKGMQAGLREVSAHPRGEGDAEFAMEFRNYADGDDAYDTWKATTGKRNKADLLLGDYASQSYRGPVDDWMRQTGVIGEGQSVYDADISPEQLAKAQRLALENPGVGELGKAAFVTPDPSLNGIQTLKRWAKLAYDNPYVKVLGTGAVSILGPLGAIADTADTAKGVHGMWEDGFNPRDMVKAAAGTTGLATFANPLFAIPAAVFGATDMAMERREEQIARKDFDRDYDKLTPGVTSHTEETPVTITPTRPPEPSQRGYSWLETLGRMDGLGNAF